MKKKKEEYLICFVNHIEKLCADIKYSSNFNTKKKHNPLIDT